MVSATGEGDGRVPLQERLRHRTDQGEEMIRYRDEGEPIKHGLNVYPPRNRHSWGWILRVGNFIWRVRWSLLRRRLFVSAALISQRRHDLIVGSWS